jgi:hypothetical protein
MKVTAILPDSLVSEVRQYSKGKNITDSLLNITDSLLIALKEWLALRKVKELNRKVDKQPLEFDPSFRAEKARDVNSRP